MQGKDNRFVLEQPLPEVCRGWEPTLSRYQKNINYLFDSSPAASTGGGFHMKTR